ncbi:MAG: hypothetical protein WC900_07820 [Oscillospiraceae bacterium]
MLSQIPTFNIVNANELFYRIVGNAFDHSVYKIIHEVDFKSVQECILKATFEQTAQAMVKMLYDVISTIYGLLTA